MNKHIKILSSFVLAAASLGAGISHGGVILRAIDLTIDGGEYAGDVAHNNGANITLPSVELSNNSVYQLSVISPLRAPYHLYLRYQSLSAAAYQDQFVNNPAGRTNVYAATTDFEKDTFDIGIYLPGMLQDFKSEYVMTLRYDNIQHKIAADNFNQSGINTSRHDQALWGLHTGAKVYLPITQSWTISTGAAANLMFGKRESEYNQTNEAENKNRDSDLWFGLDAEIALNWKPNAALNLQAGYSYSIMWDYIQQDLYAPDSLSPDFSPSNQGEADYIEQGPFLELGFDY